MFVKDRQKADLVGTVYGLPLPAIVVIAVITMTRC